MNKEFTILDLGAHDGFVTLWLARQLRERGIEPVIRGLELHPGAVTIANDRAMGEGFDANYQQGLAEAAPQFWPMYSFDAVISYEVIEHVPDVERFLDVCEAMCKPEGRVYLSTPNGCFGTGNNPHHLRVYRDIDLYNVLRRRGTIENFHQGADGVSVVSYTPYDNPDSRKEAAVYAGAGWEKWHPRDIETRGLGGSETAAASVARELVDLGYNVTLYGELEEGMWNQVELRHHSIFDPLEKRDLVIVSRTPQLFDRPINAGRKVLWMHDTDYGSALTSERADNMDEVFVLSNWHDLHVVEMYPFLESKVSQTVNGINSDYFPADKLPAERPPRAIYSSSPDRGLDFLLSLWPQVRERVPDAELVYCYADVYNRVADVDPKVGAFRDEVRRMADQEGVVNLGALTQPDLASAMATCKAWLAPSYNGIHNQPFYETFCIGSVEAAAAGCIRVMSPWGALPERAEDGVYIPTTGDIEDTDTWVNMIVSALTSTTLHTQSPEALEYTWARAARDLAG